MFGPTLRRHRRRACAAALATILAAVLALAAAPAVAQTATCEDPAVLRFALVAQDKPVQQLRPYLPLLDLLAGETGKPIDIVIPGSDPSAVEALGGWVHFAVLPAEVYVDARNANPAIAPFAAPAWAPGHLQNEAPGPEVVLISRRSGDIRGLRGAKGTVAGLADRESALGYAVPAAIFTKRAGVDLESHFSEVVITGSHESSVEALMEGRLDVAFVDARSLDRMIDGEKLQLEDIKLLWRSPPLSGDPLVFGAGLCDGFKKTIAKFFLTLHIRFEVRKFLERLKSPRMLPVTDADYQIIRDLRAAAAAESAQ